MLFNNTYDFVDNFSYNSCQRIPLKYDEEQGIWILHRELPVSILKFLLVLVYYISSTLVCLFLCFESDSKGFQVHLFLFQGSILDQNVY